MNEDSFDIQRKIKFKADELQAFLTDLSSWEDDIKKKERQTFTAVENKHGNLPEIRSKRVIKENEKDLNVNVENLNMKSSNKISRISSTDYKAWDNFNDSACEVIENDTKNVTENKNKSEYDRETKCDNKHTALILKNKGNYKFNEEKWDEAIKFYDEALLYDPENAILYANRAMALLKKKNYFSAEHSCTKSISINPKYAKSYFRRALARKEQKKFEEALSDFDYVLQLEPANIHAKQEINNLKKMLEKLYSEENDLKTPFVLYHNTKKVSAINIPPNRRYPEPLTLIPIQELFYETDKKEKSLDDNQHYLIAQTEGQESLQYSQSVIDVSESIKLNTFCCPKTSIQFLTEWKHVPMKDKGLYLRQLNPKSFSSLFQDCLDAFLLSDILEVLVSDDAFRKTEIFEYILSLTKVKRFDIVVLFLTEHDKQNVYKLLLMLEGEVDRQNIDKLCKSYKIDLL